MPEVKLTKNELRGQQGHLQQLKKYLPTLQLKKAMLQLEVNQARQEVDAARSAFEKILAEVNEYSALLTYPLPFDIRNSAKICKVNKHYENIAGVEIPRFESVEFQEFSYDLFDTPAWVDRVAVGLRVVAEAKVKIDIAEEKKAALEKELREVSIRVNLFEKILIPRAIKNIKKIKIFLGDQQLAAVSQAKVAKAKIEERKSAQVSHAS
jgi:V/A-type H+-transporting ATPase subunit D